MKTQRFSGHSQRQTAGGQWVSMVPLRMMHGYSEWHGAVPKATTAALIGVQPESIVAILFAVALIHPRPLNHEHALLIGILTINYRHLHHYRHI